MGPDSSSPLSQLTQGSGNISQASNIRAERDMTGKLRHDRSAPKEPQGADIPAALQVGSSVPMGGLPSGGVGKPEPVLSVCVSM